MMGRGINCLVSLRVVVIAISVIMVRALTSVALVTTTVVAPFALLPTIGVLVAIELVRAIVSIATAFACFRPRVALSSLVVGIMRLTLVIPVLVRVAIVSFLSLVASSFVRTLVTIVMLIA